MPTPNKDDEQQDGLQFRELHPQFYAGAVARIDALGRRERQLQARIDDRMESWSLGYTSRVNQAFYQHFHNTWDFGVAHQTGVDQELQDDADETLDTTQVFLHDDLKDAVNGSYRDGYLLTLWDMYRHGHISEDDLTDVSVPGDEDVSAWAALALIGGLTLADRLNRWVGNAKLRSRTSLQAALVRGMNLNDTGFLFETLAGQVAGQVYGLGESELQRYFVGGQQEALALLGDSSPLIGQLWVTRKDGRVCPACAALEGKITTLIPVLDTHPRCRCLKVPIFELDSTGFASIIPVSFDDFSEWMQAE